VDEWKPLPLTAAVSSWSELRDVYTDALSSIALPPPLDSIAFIPRRSSSAATQGLTLVNFSAQLEPTLTPENPLHTLNTL